MSKSESPDISFEKGINQDVHPSQIPQGQYYDAEGILIDSNEGMNGSTYALNNEKGFTEYSDFKEKKPDHLIMGMFPYGDRVVIFSIKPSIAGNVVTTLESEIGYIRDEVYTEVLNDTDPVKNPSASESFNFDIRYVIDARFKPNYKNELIIYWTDIGLNPPRFLNLDLDYTLANNVFNNLSQQTTVFETIDSPIVTYISTIEGGNVKPGLYHFAVRYLNKTLDPTTFGLLCNGIPVVDDGRGQSRLFYDGADYQSTNISKALELEVTNIDQDFFYIEVAVLTYEGAASTPSAFLIKRERIKGNTSTRVVFDGRVGEAIPFALLTETKPVYDTAKHIETKDNRLLLSNLSLNGSLNLQPIANAIRLKYSIEEIEWVEDCCLTHNGDDAISDGGTGEYGLSNFKSEETYYPENYEAGGGFDDYKDEELTFNRKGWGRDECYSLAIVGILKVGGFTESFHIPGFYDSDTLGMPEPGEYDNNGGLYTGSGNTEGYLNVFVSEDKYDDPDNLYYFDNGNTTLHGEYIRHHLFPTHAQEPHYRIDGVETYIRPMGIKIEGLDQALIDNPDLDSKLAGIILVREQRNTFSNRRVYAMGCVNRMSYWNGAATDSVTLGTAVASFEVVNPVYTINPLFGDTVVEVTENSFAQTFYGRNYPLNNEALKSCAWYSPESILTRDFTVPVSARLINIAFVSSNLRECMTGTTTKNHIVPIYSVDPPPPPSAYGTNVIAVAGEVNSILTSETPFIEDWELPYAGQWNYGHYWPVSDLGKLPRGFKFYLFADFNKEPEWYTDNIDPFYPATYNQSNGIRVGMSIKRSYGTLWNSDKHTDPNLLTHLVGEKYRLNNYGNEGYLVIECGEQINVPFDNATGKVFDAGLQVGHVAGFGPYPKIREYLNQDNVDKNPEFYLNRLNVGLYNIGGSGSEVNDNDFMHYAFDDDGNPMAIRDLYIIKNLVKNQYKQLDGNEYIVVDTLLREDQARDSNELEVAETRILWNGDVFISKFFFKTSITIPYGFYDYQASPGIWEDDYPDWQGDTGKLLEVYGPVAPELQDRKGGVLKAGNYYFVESEINCNYRHFPVERDEQGNITKHGVPYYPKQNKHKVLSPDAELGQSNGYNINYSHENDLRKFFLRPFGFEEVTQYPDRTITSEQQFEGEASDQFRQFFFNTYQDIPKNNGEITSLFVHRNTLYAHVERSIYRMFFNETAIVPSSTQDILLGNAGVFSRLAQEVYVVNNNGTHAGYCGSIHKFANVNTPYGRIIVDYYQKKIFLFTDTISEISQNGLWKWWKNNMIFTGSDINNPNYIVNHINPFAAGILTIFDPDHKRVIIVFREEEEFKCRSFSLINNAWISLHQYDPHVACVFDTKIISTNNPIETTEPERLRLALHDSGAYGLYYNQEEYKESSITFIARPAPATDKTPDNFEVFVEFYDHGSNRLVKAEFFDLMEFWNDHQYTGIHPIILEDSGNEFNVNVVRSQNHYNLKTPLSITVNESDNIFDAGNQDANLEDKPRMRGQYLYGKFTYNNDSNFHFVLQYIFSIFRISRR